VTITIPGATVTVKGWGGPEEAPSESVAVAMKEYGVSAVTVGAVPLSVAPIWVSQAGRMPNVQVMAPVPPVAVNVSEYPFPEPTEGSGFGVVMVTGAFTVMDNGWTALTAPALSVTVTKKLNGVGAVTTGARPPRVAPVSVSQAGRLAAE
jgi:hypothetical protein